MAIDLKARSQALREQVKALKQELKTAKSTLKTREKEWPKTLASKCDQAYEEGYNDALDDQDALDAAFNTYMDKAAKQFETSLLQEAKTHHKKAPKKTTPKTAPKKKKK